MRITVALALAAALAAHLPAVARAAEPATAPAATPRGAPEGAPFEMESYQLVILVRAPTWRKLPDAESNALQARHLAHLEKMGNAGKAVVCGPFDNQPDPAFRGACIYAVKTPEEARALAAQDPAVLAGQLRVDVMTWWVGKGYMTFPKAPAAADR
jgi:uncharacterized protein YciI